MAVYRPTYATRRQVKSAMDIEQTADYDAQVDSALMQAADDVDRLCHRRFYNVLETHLWDWPNFQRAYPWRIWFDQHELADVTVTAPTVTSGGSSIPDSAIFWGPWQSGEAPPFTFMELDRSQSFSFGVGPTPQRDVSITGQFGYWLQTRAAGALAAAVSSSSATTVTVTDSSQLDAGDVLTVDSESMLVQDYAMADTGSAQSGSGCSTESMEDNQLTPSAGTLYAGEVVQLDGERMLITGVSNGVATVIRSYDGTNLATHSSAEIYAFRQLTVERGFGGTTAATHNDSASIVAALVPGTVHELSLAEALNTVLQKTSGYARTIGENQRIVPGGSLPDLRDRCYQGFGRKGRRRVV